MNLIVNATHAIDDVKGSCDEMGVITVASQVENENVLITVSDTGGGIEK